MKDSFKIFLAIVLIVALFWLFTAGLGFLIWGLIFAVIGGLTIALVRMWLKTKETGLPGGGRLDKDAHRAAEKKLKDVERRLEAERIRR